MSSQPSEYGRSSGKPLPEVRGMTAPRSPRKRCRIVPQLIPLKIVIFVMYGGMAALYPFFTLHMKSIGITITETAVMSFLLPILSCMFVPFAGALADKVGQFKWIILGFTTLHVLFHLLLLGVPAYREIERHTRTEISSLGIEFVCQKDHSAVFYVPNHALMGCATGKLTTNSGSLDMENELQIDDCFTDCSMRTGVSPSICFFSSTTTKGPYCTEWTDLEQQIFKDITLSRSVTSKERNSTNSNWEALQFRNDEGFALTSAQCVRGVNGHLKRRKKSSECSVYCQATSLSVFHCREAIFEGNQKLTLSSYFILRLLGLIGLTSVFIILDSITLQMIAEFSGATFGAHRIFASLAFVFLPPISGYFIEVASGSNRADFSPAFILFGSMNMTAALIALLMKVPFSIPKKDIWHNVGKVVKSAQVIGILFIMTMAGMADGYANSFLFWFLEAELSAPKWLLGVGSATANLLAIPVYIASHVVISKAGHSNIMVICLLLNSLRFVCYSVLTSSYWFPVIEILTSLTLSAMYTVPVHYAHVMAPNYVSTLQSLITAATFGLGRGLGALIGGYIIAALGHRLSFRIFALVFLIIGVLYALIHWFFLRKTIKDSETEEGKGATSLDGSFSRSSELFPDDMSAMVALYGEDQVPSAEMDPAFDDLKAVKEARLTYPTAL